MGPTGSGQLTKMINQICIAGLVQGLAEGIHFGKQAGLDIEKVVDVISKGAAGSWQMENRHKTMNAGKYDHGFAVDWMRKDLDIVLNEAKRNGATAAGDSAGRPVLRRCPEDGRQALGHILAAGASRKITWPRAARRKMPLTPCRISWHGLKSTAQRQTSRAWRGFGITTVKAFGVGNAVLRPFAKTLGRDHERALALWETGYREARLLALFTDEPQRVSPAQARAMATDFDSWEIVDTAADLFVEAGHLVELVPEFAR